MPTKTPIPAAERTQFRHGEATLRALPDWPGYFAGSDGHIYSVKRGIPKRLRAVLNRRLKVWAVSLYRPDKRYDRLLANGTVKSCVQPQVRSVHTLVASAWLPPKPSPAHEIDHRNERRDDNRPENLRWVTKQENVRHYLANHPDHRSRAFSGERNGSAVLTEEQVRDLRALRGAVSQRRAARRFGVAASTVVAIWHGRTWKHVA